MDCSGLLRHQETMGSQPLDSMLMCTKPENSIQQSQQEKKPRPADEQAMKCPRCDSTNTKFCYYNNYSLTQPRYFCKSCRRYWTKGGTLRNVPVGGGCRRNKRSSSISKRGTPDCHLQVHDHLITTSSPLCSYDHQTLALAHGNSHFDLFGSPSGSSFIDTLRSGLPENTSHHFLYYGHGRSANHLGDNVENGRDVNNGVDGSLEIKHEVGEDRILWGLPWQLNGERNYMMNGGNNEIDSLKGSWNSAVVGPTPTYWNNLINSPLM